jgi:hypothetical protein
MVVPAFKDPSTREAFARSGYTVVPGMFAQNVPQLTAIYRSMLGALDASDPYFEPPMTGTTTIGSVALRRRICDDVSTIIAPRLGELLDDYRFLGAGFRVKQAGPHSALPQHQDPTMVDEERYWSMNVIVPIVDTTPDNGALRVVPGSHRTMPKLRSLDLQDRAETFAPHELTDPLVETVPMRAGDAIFYLNALLHGSGPNMTTQERPLVMGTLLSRDTPMTVYFRSPHNPRILERYEVPDDYFNRMENFERDHKLRPTIGRRVEDVEDTYDFSYEKVVAALRG